MLQFQLQQAPLAFGLAEGVDPHQAPFGTLMTAENARWTRTGRLEKRTGLTFLSAAVPNAFRIFARLSELSCIDSNGSVFSWSSVSSTWNSHFAAAPVYTIQRSTAWDTVQGSKSGDVCISSDGTITYAWVTGSPAVGYFSGGVVYFRQTDASGNEITPSTQVHDSTTSNTNVVVRAVVSGTTVKILWVDAGNLTTYDVTSKTYTTLKNNVFSSTSYGPYDVQVMGSSMVIAYFNGTNIYIGYWSFAATPVAGNSVLVTAESAIVTQLGLCATQGENIYVIYATSTPEIKAVIFDTGTTPAQVVAPFVLETTIPTAGLTQVGVARLTSATAIACWYTYGTNTTVHATGDLRYCAIGNSGINQGGQLHVSGVTPASRPFVMNGSPYILATNNIADISTTNGDTFLLSISAPYTISVSTTPPAIEVGHPEVLLGGQFSSQGISSVPSYGGTFFAVVPFVSSAGTLRVRQGGRLLQITKSTLTDSSLRPVRFGAEVYFSGATVTSYDGDNVLPGWSAFPPSIGNTSATATTGGTLAAGNYVVNVHTERRNYAGVLHRGPTAVAKLFTTTGATGKINLVLTPVWVGSSADSILFGRDILIPVYVSQVGQSIPQRYTGDPATNMVYDTYATATDIAAPVTAPVVTSAAAIYTASGELDDYQPPSSLYLTDHQNRLWSIGPDGNTVWFSKDATVNPGVAPGFHPSLTLTFNDRVVALQTLDSALLAFTATGLYAIQGDGPAPNGQGATYQAVKVQTDVGCTNPRSVVSMPDGVMFQSTRGIYMVDRGLGVSFVGKPVQDQTSSATITSAVLVAKKGEIRFALSSGESVVYNYVEKQWSTAKYTSNSVYGAVIVDACVWNGNYTALFSDGNIAYEVEGSYLDGSAYVPMTVETAWNNAAGPLAYQAVRSFSCEGVANTNHQLAISVGFDTETSYSQFASFVDGSPVTTIGPLTFDISVGARRKCQSIRFKIQDSAPSTLPVGTGQGPSFDTIGVEVGAKRGFRAKPATKTG